MADPIRVAPGPRGHWLWGSLPQFRDDPIHALQDPWRAYGDVVRLRFGPKRVHLLVHPDHVRHVLQENNKNYGKQTIGFAKLRKLLGNGLLTSEGEFWLRQRRIAQPAFHRQRIAGFGGAMVRATSEMLARWQPGATLDIAAEMMALTLRIVGQTMLSADVSHEAGTVGNAITWLLEDFNVRIKSAIDWPLMIPTRSNRRFLRERAALDRVVNGIIEERRKPGAAQPEDLLSMLMAARDEETGGAMDDRQLRDEILTVFLAGHETTANALTWTFYLLSQNPDAEARLASELSHVLAGRAPGLEDLARLPWTRAVVDEAMRLYPPAWMITRSVTGDDVVGGYRLPAGSLVFLVPHLTHRHPAFWPEPERFDPERFTAEKAAQHPRFAYFPFGGGPRQCIGNSFALMEAQLLLATIGQRWRLSLAPGHPVALEPLITLRPRHGMKMVLQRVASAAAA